MPNLRATLVATIFLAVGVAHAQYYDPFEAEMMRLNAEIDQFVREQYARIGAQQQASQQQFADYYRQHTGDYQTPDALAADRGMALYCQHNEAECQEVAAGWGAVAERGHAARMADIDSMGRTTRTIGEAYGGILDESHEGFQGRQTANDMGHGNMVQGVIRGQATFADPVTGAGYDLPLQPDPHAWYATPDGRPLSFDPSTGTWFVGDAYGYWQPLQPHP